MKSSWIFFTARKFLKNRRSTRGLTTAILSSAGIAVGVAALIVVVSVMNGFQLGFIEDILEISSHHLRITAESRLTGDTLDNLREIPGIRSVVGIAETQTLLYGESDGLESCRVIGVPADIQEKDPGFIAQLDLISGSFREPTVNSILLGSELAAAIAAGPGSVVSLLTLSSSKGSGLTPQTVDFNVVGVFESGYYQYDRGLGIVSLDGFSSLTDEEVPSLYGVKLVRQNALDRSRREISDALAAAEPNNNFTIETWRSYNSSFFGTLRTEKLVMMFLIGLIFLVTGFNTYHSLKRAIYEKREQIAVLRALGARPTHVRSIFVIDGLLIGFVGAIVGVMFGLLVAGNINEVFAIVETVANSALRLVSRLAARDGNISSISFFSPVYFYLSEVPIRVLFLDVFYSCTAGLLSSLVAAFFAARRISGITPAEVLRYE